MKLLLYFLIVTCVLTNESMANEKPLLATYRGKFEIPDDLYETYEQLTVAFKKGDQAAIERLCLPQSVKITTAVRPPATEYLGNDVNLPFAQTSFLPQISDAIQYESDTIQLRTGTSMLCFVQTKRGKWRLYAYLDKPIQ